MSEDRIEFDQSETVVSSMGPGDWVPRSDMINVINGKAPGPQWDAESDRIDAEIAADREEALSPGHVDALKRAEVAEKSLHEVATQLGEFAVARQVAAAHRDFLLAHSSRLVDRLAGAKLEKGDFAFDGATEFVNAERQAINAVMERIGGGA